MFKIIVLVSGSGTNMLQLIKNDIKIDCIIADRECKAKNIADEYKIDFVLLNRDKEISKNLLIYCIICLFAIFDKIIPHHINGKFIKCLLL